MKRNQIEFSRVRKYYKEFLFMGLLGLAVNNLLIMNGLSYTTSSQGSIIEGIGPGLVALFAVFINKEKLDDPRKYLGILLSFLGVFVVIGLSIFFDYQPSYTKKESTNPCWN